MEGRGDIGDQIQGVVGMKRARGSASIPIGGRHSGYDEEGGIN